ncbi:hypothetical protein [Polaromonas sp. SM01]|uniref:hypothetical protein n=1 Tax=Polaromonas sp. SM01 TaxID=3085630 RepID=UPI0029818019|nr:hypothetical protein [Polaromonas sp. SM01]MDW5441435.1 hypothetical protein [Polaromonas sp. SM01]
MTAKLLSSALIAVAALASMNTFAAGADNPLEPTRTVASSSTHSTMRMQTMSLQQPGAVTSSNQVDGGMIAMTPRTSQRNRSDVRAEGTQARSSAMYNAAPGRA